MSLNMEKRIHIYTNEELEQIGIAVLGPTRKVNLGPFVVSLALDWFFCGIYLMQVYHYAITYPTDKKVNKALVLLLTLFAVGLSITCLVWVFDLFVINFGSYYHFFLPNFLGQFYLCDSIITLLVQAFFGWRAFELVNRNYFFLAFISALSLMGFIMGVFTKTIGDSLGSTANVTGRRTMTIVYTWLGATVAADVVITATLLIAFFRRKTGWTVTDNFLKRLIKLTFESQLPPTLNAIILGLQFIFLLHKAPYMSIPFVVLQSKLYSFSVLHTLNSREGIGRERATTLSFHGGNSTARLKSMGGRTDGSRSKGIPVLGYGNKMSRNSSDGYLGNSDVHIEAKTQLGSSDPHGLERTASYPFIHVTSTFAATHASDVDVVLEDLPPTNGPRFTNRGYPVDNDYVDTDANDDRLASKSSLAKNADIDLV